MLALGVVSGLVMSYQFGTNWSGFSQFAGSIMAFTLQFLAENLCRQFWHWA
ncbi:hypothetical protein C7D71_30915 [Klebsiella pneumoniae]|nr:hypothetical protein C7D71_30915 [Klebsiella pneumoniae]